MSPSPTDRLLNEAEAAEMLGVSPHTLNRWRVLRRGPEFLKLGARIVKYRAADLTAWAETGRKRTDASGKAARR